MPRRKWKIDWLFLLLLPIPLFWVFLQETKYQPFSEQRRFIGEDGFLTWFENRFIDWRFRLRGEIRAPAPVVYVNIDSLSIDEMGNFPWDRERFATTCAALLQAGGVRAVGVDIVMSEQGVPEIYAPLFAQGTIDLARFLWRNPPVVLAASYSAAQFRDALGQLSSREIPMLHLGTDSDRRNEDPEVPAFRLPNGLPFTPPRVGLIDTMDGDTRWVPVFAPAVTRTFHHMSVEVLLAYWGLGRDAVTISDNRLEIIDAEGVTRVSVPLTRQQLLEVNWFSRWRSDQNLMVSFSVVYNYARMLRADDPEAQEAARAFFRQFEGTIVMIGPTDPLLQDLGVTSFDSTPVPKVSVHGNLVKSMLAGRYLTRTPPWVDRSLIALLTFFVAGSIVAGGVHGLRAKLMSMLFLTAFLYFSLYFFSDHDLILPVTAPLGSALSTSFVALLIQLIREEKQKGRIKAMFGSYVSPELVDQMVESGDEPRLGGTEEEITAYFSDIQSFSTFSEKLTAVQLVDLMNEYLTVCTDILTEEGGTLDKYIGDAVVAIYGAPVRLSDHALRAAISTQRVHRRLDQLREEWKGMGDKWPTIVHELRTRIGLNTGLAVIGNMGSRTRFNYTMMGDNVNLAARMESGAKAYGAYTMVTEATKEACERTDAERCIFRYLDKIVVKGRSRPVSIYEIVGLKEDVSQRTFDCLEIYARAVARYLAQDWRGAAAEFTRSAALEPNRPGAPGVESNPSLVMRERCSEMRANPPGENWDGVYVMKTK